MSGTTADTRRRATNWTRTASALLDESVEVMSKPPLMLCLVLFQKVPPVTPPGGNNRKYRCITDADVLCGIYSTLLSRQTDPSSWSKFFLTRFEGRRSEGCSLLWALLKSDFYFWILNSEDWTDRTSRQ